ncbi:hypothetical protein J6TS2_16390 [Heyndrickxia sporothermodurans]|nr:hypothetical protein J6TS2_16390 [Heyndrickxia sporothermodurans]
MFYEKNKQLFKKVFPKLIRGLDLYKEDKVFQKYYLINTKQGVPSLQFDDNSKLCLLHSKYDPYKEVATIIKKHENAIKEKEHIIFMGIGLGYHIEILNEMYPNKTFTIYEPNPYIFIKFLESRDLSKFPISKIKYLYILNEDITSKQFLQFFANKQKGDFHLFILPTYERYFKNETEQFMKEYLLALKLTKTNVSTQRLFGKRWILNSLMNFPTTLTTPNLIFEKKEYFKGKPLIIASAGPSLYEDIEHLKEIKEKGLAYIFAVGSANKALLKNGVVPDAIVTYDPQPHNYMVFNELIESGRTDIPMIYGTSVGFETLEQYQGPKLHIITSNDTISNYYFDKTVNIDVFDSYTVALIALQIAIKVEAHPIILAGQNLAFKNNRYYSNGVSHSEWNGELREENELIDVIQTIDVYGNLIETNESLNNMKVSIEQFINQINDVKIYNTTKGGAAIKGVPFVPIEDLFSENSTSSVVDLNWHKLEKKFDFSVALKKTKKMERSIKQVYTSYQKCLKILTKLNENKRSMKVNFINRTFKELDEELDKLFLSDFYQVFLKTILSNEFEILNKKIQKIYLIKDQINKINEIFNVFTNFLDILKSTFEEMNVYVQKVLHRTLYDQYEDRWKTYNHDDGCFHYIGDWMNKDKEFADLSYDLENKRKIVKRICKYTSSVENKILFKFQGTGLRILGSVNSESASKIKISIDENVKYFTTKKNEISNLLDANIQQTVFEIKGLEDKIHQVKIEITKNELFFFEGIQINSNGRVYHIDEVTNLNELEIGKRIRCNYKANYNKLGEFSNLGLETNLFLSNIPVSNPDGDFYLIVVDRDRTGHKLIADRVIQNYISYDILSKNQVDKGRIIKIDNREILLRLLEGKFNSESIDEWSKYILNSEKNAINCEWGSIGLVASWIRKMEESTHTITIRGHFYHFKNYGEDSTFEYNIPSNYVYHFVGFRPVCII